MDLKLDEIINLAKAEQREPTQQKLESMASEYFNLCELELNSLLPDDMQMF